MSHSTIQAKAKFEGLIDLGASCFSIPVTEIKPKSYCRNRIFCRSKLGDRFEIGLEYDAVIKIEEDNGKREFLVVGIVGYGEYSFS